MQITVKILQGAECQLEVSDQMTVAMLKALVESQLKVPRRQQKLVFRGRTLQDEDTVAAARLPAGAKLFLVVAKKAPAAAQPEPWAALAALAERSLGREDARKVVDEFSRRFALRLANMSLDDIQRFCATDMREF